ncbi:MAG: hypothetical protein AAGM38_07525 [Pseudomonadota bacterium]
MASGARFLLDDGLSRRSATRRSGLSAYAAAFAALLIAGLGACSVVEPEAGIAVPESEKGGIYARKPPNPEAGLALVEVYRAVCLETPLDLWGAGGQLSRLGFTLETDNVQDRVYRRGDARVKLSVGGRAEAAVSNCVVTDSRLDRYASLEALQTAIEASGMRYEEKDYSALGDPFAHDVRGTLEGADFIGVASLIDLRTGSGAALLKSPKRPGPPPAAASSSPSSATPLLDSIDQL